MSEAKHVIKGYTAVDPEILAGDFILWEDICSIDQHDDCCVDKECFYADCKEEREINFIECKPVTINIEVKNG